MFNPLKGFFDYNKKEIDRLAKRVEGINKLEDSVRSLKDADFAAKTEKLTQDIQSGKQSVDQTLPYAYALVREAARRILGTRHYDVQLMAGIALHEGTVAEQKPFHQGRFVGRKINLQQVV